MASNIDILLEFRLSGEGEGEVSRRGRSAVIATTSRGRNFIVAALLLPLLQPGN